MYPANPAEPGDPFPGLRSVVFLLLVFFALVSCRNSVPAARPAGQATSALTREVPHPLPVDPPTKRKKKKIYLTFDDGPNPGTRNVLNIVQEEQVPATFFIVGQHVFASIGQNQVWDSLKMARNIELCNHSFTHGHNHYSRFYSDPAGVVRDISLTRDSLLPGNNIVRAPGRNCWRIDSLHYTDINQSRKAIDSLQAAGYVVFGWDLEWHYDARTLSLTNTADQLLNQIDSLFRNEKTKTPDNIVILAHDQVYRKPADSLQLRELLKKLKRHDDYELALASAYPGIGQPRTDTGQHPVPR